MEKINLYLDYHKFGVHGIKGAITTAKNDFHLGDMYDLKGCKKEDIEKVKDAIETLRVMSHHYVTGNHELDLDLKNVTHLYNGVLFCHGDLFHYSDYSFINWRSKKPGRSWFQRLYLKPIYWVRNRFFDASITDAIAKKAVRYAKKLGAKSVVMGHRHPLKLKKRTVDGIQLYLFPRGKHVVTIDNGDLEINNF